MEPATSNEHKLMAAIIAAWFCFALAIGVAGPLTNAGPLAVAGTVGILTALALLAWWKIPIIRNWATTVDLRVLVALHLTRFVGIYFLVLKGRGQLPAGFANPAGIGDILVASAAVLLLAVPNFPSWKAFLRIWNFFGFIDIVFVAFTALRFGLMDSHSMAALRTLPLCLLPMFLVPLIIVSHVIIFARLTTNASK